MAESLLAGAPCGSRVGGVVVVHGGRVRGVRWAGFFKLLEWVDAMLRRRYVQERKRGKKSKEETRQISTHHHRYCAVPASPPPLLYHNHYHNHCNSARLWFLRSIRLVALGGHWC